MKIHVMQTGMVYVSRIVPAGARNIIDKAISVLSKKRWVWLPVFSYLIEHPKGLILVDTGWDRSISPEGKFDMSVQAKSLGSRLLKQINVGLLPKGHAVDERIAKLGYAPKDLDYVILTHLDCDHACGLHQVEEAKHILVSEDEMKFATDGSLINRVRYQKIWWKDVPLTLYAWNGNEGPFRKSYDLFGDGSVQLICTPGHTAGHAVVKLTGADGRFALIVGDAAYGHKSWREMILPGITMNKHEQRESLEWVREQSMDKNCVASLAAHDTEVRPYTFEL